MITATEAQNILKQSKKYSLEQEAVKRCLGLIEEEIKQAALNGLHTVNLTISRRWANTMVVDASSMYNNPVQTMKQLPEYSTVNDLSFDEQSMRNSVNNLLQSSGFIVKQETDGISIWW